MKVMSYRPINKGTLKGSFDVTFVSDQFEMTVFECLLFENDKGKWVSFPSRSYDKDGKKAYIPYVSMPKDLEVVAKAEMLKQVQLLIDMAPVAKETAEVPF